MTQNEILNNYYAMPISSTTLTESGVIRAAMNAAHADKERFAFVMQKEQKSKRAPFALLNAINAIDEIIEEDMHLELYPDEALKVAALLTIGGWLK